MCAATYKSLSVADHISSRKQSPSQDQKNKKKKQLMTVNLLQITHLALHSGNTLSSFQKIANLTKKVVYSTLTIYY